MCGPDLRRGVHVVDERDGSGAGHVLLLYGSYVAMERRSCMVGGGFGTQLPMTYRKSDWFENAWVMNLIVVRSCALEG